MTRIEDYNTTTQVLALCLFSGVQPRLFEALINHFGNLEEILKSESSSLKAIKGMTAETIKKITTAATHLNKAVEFHAGLKDRDIIVKTRFDHDFPRLLFELNDPPPLLYLRGKMPDNTKKTVALIGTENATNEGIELTVKLAGVFAEAGVQIIASLSKGIDAAAHLGAKTAEGISFSIIDSGFDHILPLEHMPLAIDIAQSGGVISEYPPDHAGTDENFKTSNRILAALAQAVVVTEIYKDSTRTHDILACCNQIGKLAFIMIDPHLGALADAESLHEVVSMGAIPLVGLDKADDVIKSLV